MGPIGRLRFGPADFVFVLTFALGLGAGRHAFLNDPGTFWHLRLGRDILRTGEVPRVDALTDSRKGAEWVDQAWLFDAGLALIVDRTGWSGAVGVTAILIALTYAAMTNALIRQGASPCAAVAGALVAVGIGATHFLTRPHLFTFIGVAWTTLACRGFALSRGRSGALAWAPLVVAVWANLHGGFLAGPIIVLGSAIGFALSPCEPEERRRALLAYARVLALCVIAPLANPYGPGLYKHVWDVLAGARVTDLIQEYQPPAFGSSETRALELAIAAMIALPIVRKATMSRHDLVQTLIWLHFALGSIRQAPLFGIVAAPGLASLFAGPAAGKRVDGGRSHMLMFWSGAFGAAVCLAIALGIPLGGHDPAHWPLAGLRALDCESPSLRLFHEQDWGGMIESECRPIRPAFIDDRFELFGRKAILDYVGMLEGGPSWDEANAKRPFDLAWIRPQRPLARRLRADRNWTLVHADAVSVLLKRTGADEPSRLRSDRVSDRSAVPSERQSSARAFEP